MSRVERDSHNASIKWIHARVSRANGQLSRLMRLVDTVLDVPRVASGRLPLMLENVDLAEVVGEVVDRLEPQQRTQISTRLGCDDRNAGWGAPRPRDRSCAAPSGPCVERFERAVSDRRYDGLRPRPLITSRIVGESGGTDVAAKRARRGLDVHRRSAASRRRPPVERAREARPRRTEPRKHEEDTKNTRRTRRFFVSLRDSSPRSRIGP
jgi:hypothetical protein